MKLLPPLIAVIGPTASGKTDLGAFLAQKCQGEIISADAKQVFVGMDAGTAKETNLVIPQHLLDIRQPGERITVGDYQKLAYGVIDALQAAGTLPILVGGSGLYAESVTEGYLFGGPGSKDKQPRFSVLKIGLDFDRDVLKQRAAARLQQRSSAIIIEVKKLLAQGIDSVWLEACGIEYRHFSRYVRGEITLPDALQLTETAINQFIKRQYTWWRRHDDVLWITTHEQALQLVEDFLITHPL